VSQDWCVAAIDDWYGWTSTRVVAHTKVYIPICTLGIKSTLYIDCIALTRDSSLDTANITVSTWCCHIGLIRNFSCCCTGCPVCLVLKQGAVNQPLPGAPLMPPACLDHSRWAKLHPGTPGPQQWKKSSEIWSPKKGQISGLAQIDIFSDFLVLGVANFRINYLRQFSFNFENSCAHLAANFLNFSKHTQLFTFGWF